MRARCVGVHPPGVAWLPRQRSGGVEMVMGVGYCAIDATAAHRRRNVGGHGEARGRWRCASSMTLLRRRRNDDTDGRASDGDEPQSLSANGKWHVGSTDHRDGEQRRCWQRVMLQ
jgi:hypothetical protein